jgi:hypothetical protein
LGDGGGKVLGRKDIERQGGDASLAKIGRSEGGDTDLVGGSDGGRGVARDCLG